jgi:hypothetical protein
MEETRDELILKLTEALRDALDGWEEGSQYKGEYLREKHGDAEEIAKYRMLLASLPTPPNTTT